MGPGWFQYRTNPRSATKNGNEILVKIPSNGIDRDYVNVSEEWLFAFCVTGKMWDYDVILTDKIGCIPAMRFYGYPKSEHPGRKIVVALDTLNRRDEITMFGLYAADLIVCQSARRAAEIIEDARKTLSHDSMRSLQEKVIVSATLDQPVVDRVKADLDALFEVEKEVGSDWRQDFAEVLQENMIGNRVHVQSLANRLLKTAGSFSTGDFEKSCILWMQRSLPPVRRRLMFAGFRDTESGL